MIVFARDVRDLGYDPSQERAEDGEWTDGGSDGGDDAPNDDADDEPTDESADETEDAGDDDDTDAGDDDDTDAGGDDDTEASGDAPLIGNKPALNREERAGFIRKEKEALRAALDAHAANPTAETTAALVKARDELKEKRAIAGSSNPAQREAGRTATVEELEQRKVESKALKAEAVAERHVYEAESKAKEKQLIEEIKSSAKTAQLAERGKDAALIKEVGDSAPPEHRKAIVRAAKEMLSDGVPTGQTTNVGATELYPEQTVPEYRVAPSLKDMLEEEGLTRSGLRDSDLASYGRIAPDDINELATHSEDYLNGAAHDESAEAARSRWKAVVDEQRESRDAEYKQTREDLQRVVRQHSEEREQIRQAIRDRLRDGKPPTDDDEDFDDGDEEEDDSTEVELTDPKARSRSAQERRTDTGSPSRPWTTPTPSRTRTSRITSFSIGPLERVLRAMSDDPESLLFAEPTKPPS